MVSQVLWAARKSVAQYRNRNSEIDDDDDFTKTNKDYQKRKTRKQANP
jgi:Zn-finger nucleic acid-binding protein